MTRTQQYLDMLFERFPVGELGGSPVRDTFEQLRSQCSGSEDLNAVLKKLYRVEGCDELALGLMWAAERANADLSRMEPTGEEEEVFFRGLRKSLGLTPSGEPSIQAEPSVDFPQPMPEPETVAPALGVDTVVPAEGTMDPYAFAKQLEQFLEAVQGGSDDRAPLLEVIRSSCAAIAGVSESPDDLKQYVEHLDGFLHYVTENQLLDDVRVMNLVTNIQDPFAQWIATAEAERTGLLDQATELLRDFRTMFE